MANQLQLADYVRLFVLHQAKPWQREILKDILSNPFFGLCGARQVYG